jgi:hypothetical protein
MEPFFSPFLFKRLAGQVLALFVLYFALGWLLPIAGASLLKGMLLWNNATILFCWFIQFAFIAVTVELRDTLINKAAYWFTLLPRHLVRYVVATTCILVVPVMPSAVFMLAPTIPVFSFAVAIELFLLLVQVWCLCGAAVPMSAKRFYVFFFHAPKPSHENVEWHYHN